MTQQIQGILQAPRTFVDNSILELLKMLTPLEPLKRHQDVKLPRYKGTGLWILKLESFIEWRNGTAIERNGVFCCYGIPGAGKTVIRYGVKYFISFNIPVTNVYQYSSVVIDDLRSQCPDIGVACLYADYKDQADQTLAHILGTFLRQFLTTAQEPIPDGVIQKLHQIQHQGGKLAAEENLALLKIRLPQLKRAFICIDAVDELEPKVRRQLFNALKKLISNNTHLFLTGRGHIESELQKCLEVLQKYTVVISANKEDIKTFVRQQIVDDSYPDTMDEVLEKDIIDAIVEKSQGM